MLAVSGPGYSVVLVGPSTHNIDCYSHSSQAAQLPGLVMLAAPRASCRPYYIMVVITTITHFCIYALCSIAMLNAMWLMVTPPYQAAASADAYACRPPLQVTWHYVAYNTRCRPLPPAWCCPAQPFRQHASMRYADAPCCVAAHAFGSNLSLGSNSAPLHSRSSPAQPASTPVAPARPYLQLPCRQHAGMLRDDAHLLVGYHSSG